MTYTNGKWVLINPALNFSENPEDQYSPEVWIVNDGHDTFDLPPELAEESTEYVIKWDEPEGVPITGKRPRLSTRRCSRGLERRASGVRQRNVHLYFHG